MFLKLSFFLLLISYNKFFIHGYVNEKDKAVGATNSFKSEKVYYPSIQFSADSKNIYPRNNVLPSAYTSKIVGRKKREIVLVDENFDVSSRLRRQVITKELNINPIFEESSGDGMIVEPLSEQVDELKTIKTSLEALTAGYTNSITVTEDQDNIQNSTDPDLRTDSNSEVSKDVITSTINSITVSNISSSTDGVLTDSTNSVTIVDLSTPTSNYDIEKSLNESTLISCMKSTCRMPMELMISSSSIPEMVPENTNLTFKCVSSNYSNIGLYWYKENVSASKLMTSHNQSVLELNIVEAKLFDAGIYICIKYFEGSCCYKEIHLNVYESPAYKYHLLTIGVIAAACLVTCILVGIWRHWTMSKCEKNLRDKKVNQLLLT